jgi:hypothetical protein
MGCEVQKRGASGFAGEKFSSTPQVQPESYEQRHYTVAEVAAMWNLSKDAVRRMFENEPGVLVLGARSSGRKRQYTTLRIPQSVLERVHHEHERV